MERRWELKLDWGELKAERWQLTAHRWKPNPKRWQLTPPISQRQKDPGASFSPRRKATKEKQKNPFQILSMGKVVTQAQLVGTHPEKVATHSPLVETHTQKIAIHKNPYYIVETPHTIFSYHIKKPDAPAAGQQISLFPIHTLNRCAARSKAQFLQQISCCIFILQTKELPALAIRNFRRHKLEPIIQSTRIAVQNY